MNRKQSNWLKAFVLMVVFSIVTECCHHILHLVGKRRKRQTNSTATERQFISTCMQRLSSRFTTWQGPVDYVILHSAWYTSTSALCSEALGTDTTECWLKNINSLLFSNSTLLDQVKQCIVEYTYETRGLNYTGDQFPSEEMESPFDDDLCPEVTENLFMTDLSTSTSGLVLEYDDDQTLNDLQSVVSLMKTDIICPTCSCTELSTNIGALEEFDFSNGLTCNRCWPTRMATLARTNSRLARPLGVTAVNTENLRPVNNCSAMPPANFDDPDVENMLNIQVECLSSGVSISADRCTLINLGIIFLDEFVVADPNRPFSPTTALDDGCTPNVRDDPTRKNIKFTINDLSFCDPRIMMNGTDITYSYFLRVVVDDDSFRGPITRIGNYNFNFNCSYPTNYSVSSNVSIVPRLGTTTYTIRDRPGIFNVTIQVFRRQNYTEEITSMSSIEQRTVNVPNKIYVSVDVKTTTSTILLRVERCIASNSIPAVPISSYTLINQECPAQTEVKLMNSTRMRRFRFDFESFGWTNPELTQQIFITCSVRLCDMDSNTTCERRVCSRKKRSVEIEEKTNQIVAGPFFVRQKINLCLKNNGGCSHLCLAVGDHHKCACRSGYMLLPDGRNCIEENLQKGSYFIGEKRSSSNDSDSYSTSFIIVFGFILCCFTMLNVFLYLKRFREKSEKRVF